MTEGREGCPLERHECPFFERDGFGGHTPAEALMLLWTWAVDVRPTISKLDARLDDLERFKLTFLGVCGVLVVLGIADFVSNMLGH